MCHVSCVSPSLYLSSCSPSFLHCSPPHLLFKTPAHFVLFVLFCSLYSVLFWHITGFCLLVGHTAPRRRPRILMFFFCVCSITYFFIRVLFAPHLFVYSFSLFFVLLHPPSFIVPACITYHRCSPPPLSLITLYLFTSSNVVRPPVNLRLPIKARNHQSISHSISHGAILTC